MIGHITNSGGNNSLMKHDVVQGNNKLDLDLLRNFNGVPGLNRENFIYISNIFLNIKQRNEKNHSINMFREVSFSNDIISVKFYRNEKIECACDFLMDKDAQGYIDLSDLDLTSCHFKGDVISEVSFLSSNLQHATFECKEIENCNFTKATVNNVIFKCRRLHNVIFLKTSGECVDFSQNILDTVDFSQSQLGHSNFRECQIKNSNFDNCYLYASHFTRAEFLSTKEISFIKSNLTAVMFDHVRMSTGNFKDCITEKLALTIDYSDIFGNEDLDGYINGIIQMINTLPDNAVKLKSVLAVKLVIQLKILNIVNKNFIENMKNTFSHYPYVSNPIIHSYLYHDEDDKFDIFMRQHRFSKVKFDVTQMNTFINRFRVNKWLIDQNNNFFIQLIDQALRSSDEIIRENAWYLYKEWIRSDNISPIFKEVDDYLRTFNAKQLTQNDNIFILFSSVDDGPVMVVSSQRLHDMLNPTKDTHWKSPYIFKSRHEMLPVNITPETLFGSTSHDEHALFPIFTASWRAIHKKNKGV